MKNFVIITLLATALLAGAAQPKPARVPPPGLAVAEKDRVALRAGADALAKEIESLRSSPQRELLPDVDVTFTAAGLASNAQQTPKLPDWAVFEMAGNTVTLADFFDEQWRVR